MMQIKLPVVTQDAAGLHVRWGDNEMVFQSVADAQDYVAQNVSPAGLQAMSLLIYQQHRAAGVSAAALQNKTLTFTPQLDTVASLA